MKRYCLLVWILLPSWMNAQVTNQNLYDTLPTMPDHYQRRVTEFMNEPVQTGKVIFLGNSITEGGDWQKLLSDSSVVNRGIGGDVTFGILNRLDDVVRRQPSKVFILIGINDIAKDFPADVILYNYTRIVEVIREGSPSTKIYIQSLLPLNPRYPKFPQHYDKVDHVVTVNTFLHDLTTRMRIPFIDLYPVLKDSSGKLDPSLTYDGLHLNEAGYKRWAKHLKDNGYL